MLVQKLVDEKF